METVRTGFTSAEHGFRFVNSFNLPDAVSLSPITHKPIALGDLVYGLCGGMCFAALDYFHAHKPVPTFATVDEISPELLKYLLGRQLDSLRRGVVLKVLTWTVRQDNSLARSVAGWEIPKLRSLLGSGEPAVLALIRVAGVTKLMENHQVLATGLDFEPETGQMAIHLYDPNYPGEVPALTMNLTKPSQGIALAQSTSEALRGFFVIEYKPKTPL